MMMALVVCLLTEKFKADNKNVNVPTQFCVKSVSENFDAIDCRLVSLKGNVYDLSFYSSAIDKSDILNIHKYLMVKNDMK